MVGLIQRLLKGGSKDSQEFKQKFKEAEMNAKIEKTIMERQKSSDERALEKIMEQKRQDQIKLALRKEYDKQNKDNWKSNSMINSQKRILKNDRPILKEKHIFMNNKSLFLKKGSLK